MGTDLYQIFISMICDQSQTGRLIATAAMALRDLRLIGFSSNQNKGCKPSEAWRAGQRCLQSFYILDSGYAVAKGVVPVSRVDGLPRPGC